MPVLLDYWLGDPVTVAQLHKELHVNLSCVEFSETFCALPKLQILGFFV